MPNILLITTDEQRPDCFEGGAFGPLAMPTFDRLRREGMIMRRAQAACPVCMPARYGWLHGLYPSQVAERLVSNAHDWPLGRRTFVNELQELGYRTALVGKLHSLAGLYRRDVRAHRNEAHALGFRDVTEVSGGMLSYHFDCDYTAFLDARGKLDAFRAFLREWLSGSWTEERHEPFFLDEDEQLDGFVAARAVEWLRTNAGASPWYLHVSFAGPHFPLVPSDRFYGRHSADEMPLPVDCPANRHEFWRRYRALYADFCAQTDFQVGRVVDALDEHGSANDTLVLLTTDHGDLCGDHDRPFKGSPYDASVRTPIIARLPGVIPEGVESDALVESIDLGPTIVEAARSGRRDPGLGARMTAADLPARSAWRSLVDPTARHRDVAYAEGQARDRAWRLLSDDRHHYVLRADGSEELFDRGEPQVPAEARERAVEEGAITASFRRMLALHLMRHPAPNRDGGPPLVVKP